MKRSMVNWPNVHHFTASEFDDPDHPGTGSMIDAELVYMLDDLRERAGCPIVTHWHVGGCVDVQGAHGHARTSYHLAAMGCKACDFHLDTDMDPRLQYARVESMGWGGIGIYYNWHWGGELLPIGFHVDLRPKEITQRWVCRRKNDYVYLLGR